MARRSPRIRYRDHRRHGIDGGCDKAMVRVEPFRLLRDRVHEDGADSAELSGLQDPEDRIAQQAGAEPRPRSARSTVRRAATMTATGSGVLCPTLPVADSCATPRVARAWRPEALERGDSTTSFVFEVADVQPAAARGAPANSMSTGKAVAHERGVGAGAPPDRVRRRARRARRSARPRDVRLRFANAVRRSSSTPLGATSVPLFTIPRSWLP